MATGRWKLKETKSDELLTSIAACLRETGLTANAFGSTQGITEVFIEASSGIYSLMIVREGCVEVKCLIVGTPLIRRFVLADPNVFMQIAEYINGKEQ